MICYYGIIWYNMDCRWYCLIQNGSICLGRSYHQIVPWCSGHSIGSCDGSQELEQKHLKLQRSITRSHILALGELGILFFLGVMILLIVFLLIFYSLLNILVAEFWSAGNWRAWVGPWSNPSEECVSPGDVPIGTDELFNPSPVSWIKYDFVIDLYITYGLYQNWYTFVCLAFTYMEGFFSICRRASRPGMTMQPDVRPSDFPVIESSNCISQKIGVVH